ncbi:MAG: hypothetical protein WED11_11865 [Natronospirillum sp.]
MSKAKVWTKQLLERLDKRYQHVHQLLPVGPLLLIGRRAYDGPVKHFPDGTVLSPGDIVGELHFNNARLSQMKATSSASAGLGFARLMFTSLRQLSAQAPNEPHWCDVAVYHGITWLRPHGGSVGFFTERVADGFSRRWQIAYFRLLYWAFTVHSTRPAPADPHHYWLTRTLLQQHFPAPSTDTTAQAQALPKRASRPGPAAPQQHLWSKPSA